MFTDEKSAVSCRFTLKAHTGSVGLFEITVFAALLWSQRRTTPHHINAITVNIYPNDAIRNALTDDINITINCL